MFVEGADFLGTVERLDLGGCLGSVGGILGIGIGRGRMVILVGGIVRRFHCIVNCGGGRVWKRREKQSEGKNRVRGIKVRESEIIIKKRRSETLD